MRTPPNVFMSTISTLGTGNKLNGNEMFNSPLNGDFSLQAGSPAIGTGMANPWLLKDVLRDTWGFKGYVVSDQGAVGSIFTGYHYVPTLAEAVTASINSGVDIVNAGSSNPECCEFLQTHALETVHQKVISEERLNRAVANTLRAQLKTEG